MKVHFLKAADAFLYLPIYIAQYRGIFKQISPSLAPEFSTPCAPNSGDGHALRELLKESERGSTIPIAVCDPFAMFSQNIGCQSTDLRVLGAIITKVPFWAVDGPETENVEEEDLGNNFDRIVYYNEMLVTGHYIGKRTHTLARLKNIKKSLDKTIVTYGKEFDELFQSQVKSVAITCDVISMAMFKDIPEKKLSIKHSYAKNPHYQNFITTGLVTTASTCKKYPDELAQVLQGIQASLAILRSSRDIAYTVCKELAPRPEFYSDHHTILGQDPSLTEDQIHWMVDLIYDDDFYPNTLDISKDQWNNTLDCHSEEAGISAAAAVFERGKEQYQTIVSNRYLLEGQRKFIQSIGINFNEIIQDDLHRKQQETTEALEQVFQSQKRDIMIVAYKNGIPGAISAVGFASVVISIFGLSKYSFAGVNLPLLPDKKVG